MKSSTDPRHTHRVLLMQGIFALMFEKPENMPLESDHQLPVKISQQVQEDIQQIQSNLQTIDERIMQNAPSWPISQMNKIDLAILRISVYELVTKDTPKHVVIDEAVELAKEFGTEQSHKFVNGVLSSISNDLERKA